HTPGAPMTHVTTHGRIAASVARLSCTAGALLAATPALAENAGKIHPSDTAWMISATPLALMMTMPGLPPCYCGMVRKKSGLGTMGQRFACAGLCSILWFAFGYSLTFVGDGPWLGTLAQTFLRNASLEATSALAPTIPEFLFMFYQMTFAIITVALVAGS